MINSVFFGHTFTTSSAYYRMIGYAKKLEKKGNSVYFNEWDPEKYKNTNRFFEDELEDPKTRDEVLKQFQFLHDVKNVKAWIFQPISTVWGLSLMDLVQRHWHQAFITEIDDYFLHLNADNANEKYYRPGHDNVKIKKAQIEDSGLVIVSTEELKKQLLFLNKHIEVIPNSVDFSKIVKLDFPTKDPNKIIIGWEGGGNHSGDLKILERIVPEIIKKYPQVEFVFYGDPDVPRSWVGLPRIKVIKDWQSIITYHQAKANLNFDIELAPLMDTLFNRCKSNLRWIEAAAMKIPVVASDVIPYRNTNALLCKTDQDWIAAISKLIEDAEKRKQLGIEGNKLVRKNFNMSHIASKYGDIIDTEVARVEKTIKELKAKGYKYV